MYVILPGSVFYQIWLGQYPTSHPNHVWWNAIPNIRKYVFSWSKTWRSHKFQRFLGVCNGLCLIFSFVFHPLYHISFLQHCSFLLLISADDRSCRWVKFLSAIPHRGDYNQRKCFSFFFFLRQVLMFACRHNTLPLPRDASILLNTNFPLQLQDHQHQLHKKWCLTQHVSSFGASPLFFQSVCAQFSDVYTTLLDTIYVFVCKAIVFHQTNNNIYHF